MNPRLAKELRPLVLPWGIAVVGACGHFAAICDPGFANGAFGNLLTGLAGTAFFIGILVLAAMPIGVELHERTLSLLLSQPEERVRLWKEKLLATSLLIGSLAVVHGVASVVTGQLNLITASLCAGFAIAAICSVGYHTLSTRSVLIGIICAVGIPYALVLTAYLVVRYLFGVELELSERAALTLTFSAGAIYSALCLWLSRRQFINLQLNDTVSLRAAEVPAALVPKALSNLVRPRLTDVTLNLIRKEACLHKPLFLVSAIFTAAWLLTLLLMVVRPAWHEGCVATLHGLTGAQVVLMVILGGCTALGDDKALGTSMWHLTLPVSARRQWLIKLFTALGTTIVLAALLPTLLALATLFTAKVGFLVAHPHTLMGITLVCLGVFVVSFWSASMTANTVRAALTTILCLFVFGLTMALAVYWAGPNKLAAMSIVTDRLSDGVFAFTVGSIAILALYQCFCQFRRIDTKPITVLRNMGVLAVAIFAVTYWRVHMYSFESQGPDQPRFEQRNHHKKL